MPSTRTHRSPLATALTIAGSDSGGGAGVQADLKTFASLGVHGTSAITAVTAQNPREVTAIQAIKATVVLAQIEAVFAELEPRAIKTGMLHSSEIIRRIADFVPTLPDRPWVVDPVMFATSGTALLRPAARHTLADRLLPVCTLVTPNLDEARFLAGMEIHEAEDLRSAARTIRDRYGCAVLLKGGHLPGPEAVDLFWDGTTELLLSAPRITGLSSHGTGCTYAAAITGYLALGCELIQAVQLGKNYITQALSQAGRAGRHPVLEHFWTE